MPLNATLRVLPQTWFAMVLNSNHAECVDQYMLTLMYFPALEDGLGGVTQGKAKWQITQAKRRQLERADEEGSLRIYVGSGWNG